MNTYGTLFKVTIYGESHGLCCGVVIDGIKPGLKVNVDDLCELLSRRKSGKLGTTPRKESDTPHILSGVFNGYTTGSPVNISFDNSNTISKDYSNVLSIPRPSHADYVAHQKYSGYEDYRGGGSFSGRLTLGIVVAGYFANLMLPFKIESKIIKIGKLELPKEENKLADYLSDISNNHDSIGGIIQLRCNPPCGLGEPFFSSVESKVAEVLFSIPAVKGVEFGIGFDGIDLLGSQFNDVFIDASGKTKTNNNGGINGGITNGNEVLIRTFVKPTPSIMKKQETFNFEKEKMDILEIKGRHDVCIALRSQVVLEMAVAIALCDLYLIASRYN